MNIGKVKISNNLVLAPMAGVNCTAFRLMCKNYGAGLIYTQMYHADFICHKADTEGNDAVADYIGIQVKERPVSVQLVGHNPKTMSHAAKIVSDFADIIDINLGCCDTNIIKSGAGAYFAKYPEKIPEIVNSVMDNTNKPVTAKIRIGYDAQNINGVATAQRLEQLGISAIAVHGRVATQKYAGKANWQIIKHIKGRLSIPVIGSGDVKDQASMEKLFATTNCDFAMVGRRAMGDPGIFAELSGNEKPDSVVQFREFVTLYNQYDKSFTELRTHALWFAKRARLGAKKRQAISQSKTIEEINELFGILG